MSKTIKNHITAIRNGGSRPAHPARAAPRRTPQQHQAGREGRTFDDAMLEPRARAGRKRRHRRLRRAPEPESAGFPDTVIIEVTLDRHDDDIFEKFGQALADLPEVMEAYLLTGEYDYLIKVAVAGIAGYEEFLRRKLYKLPGLRHSRSTFVLRCLKRSYSVQP